MTKLNTIPTELQIAIDSFFDLQSAKEAEVDLWDMFSRYIETHQSDNADKSFTYRQLTKFIFSLEKYQTPKTTV